jgi:predicted nucleic-acid-binding Zn-ribbon protein
MTDDTEKRPPHFNPRHKPCPVCGGLDYTWGSVVVTGQPLIEMYFRPDGGRMGSGRSVQARECKRCGNVQWFTKA